MDPLSIASAAAAGAKSLFIVVDLIAAYKQVDQSIRTLESLSRGLARVLDHLAEALNDPVLNYQKNAGVWTSVHDTVQSCKTTIASFDAKLAPVREATRSGVQQAWRAFTLALQQPEIDRLVSNMKTHSINLQLALQTVNVIITASIPGAITADQAGRFDRLERMIEAIRVHIDASDGPARLEADNNGLRAVAIDRNTTQLFLSAASIVTSSMAGTVRSSSSVDAPVAASRTLEPAFEDYTSVVATAPFMLGSEAQSLDEEHRAQIHAWIPRSPDEVIPEDESEAVALDEDFDEEFEFEVTVEIFEAGMDYYSQRRFGEAQENLSRGLDRAKGLANKRKEELDLNSMQFHHALSCMAQSNLDEAEASFRLVVAGSNAGKGDPQVRCLALYQLARVQLKLSQGNTSGQGAGEALDSAEKYCKQAVSRMRKEPSIGRDQPAYHGALRLLALIYWAKGHRIEARAASKLLPPALHIKENQFDEQLTLVLTDHGSGDGYQRHPGSSTSTSPTPSSRPPIEQTPFIDLARMQRLSVANEKIPASTHSVPVGASVRSISLESTHDGTVKSGGFGTGSSPGNDGSSMRYYNAAAAADIIRRKGFKKHVNKGLYWAAQHGNLDVLNVMLEEASADISTRKTSFWSNEETLLRIAAMGGHYAICERLLAANAAINAMIDGQTALDAAIDKCHIEICRLFLDRGANANGQASQRVTPLLRAVNCGNQAIRELVVGYVSNINEPEFSDTRKGRTALMQAAAYNKTKVVRWLLSLGANPNGPDPSVTTPLIEAARANAMDACRILLKSGADLHLSTSRGVTAAKASTGWLKGFILAWPESRDWKQPEYAPTLQP